MSRYTLNIRDQIIEHATLLCPMLAEPAAETPRFHMVISSPLGRIEYTARVNLYDVATFGEDEYGQFLEGDPCSTPHDGVMNLFELTMRLWDEYGGGALVLQTRVQVKEAAGGGSFYGRGSVAGEVMR